MTIKTKVGISTESSPLIQEKNYSKIQQVL
jgi:hypothetical protein